MFLTTIIWAIDQSYRKYLIKNIIDVATLYQGQSNIADRLLVPCCYYIFLAMLVTTIFRSYGYFIDVKMCPRFRQRIADKVYRILLDHDHSYFQENFTGDLVHKLNNFTDSLIEIIKLIIDRFFGCSLALTLSIYILYTVNIKFAIATFIWIIIFFIVSVIYLPLLSKLANNYSESSTKVTANISDSIINIFSVRLFNNYKYEYLKFFRACRKKILAEEQLCQTYFRVWFVYGYTSDALQIINIYFLIYGYQAQEITVGDFILVIGLNMTIVDHLNQLTKDFAQFSNHYGKIINTYSSVFIPSKIQDIKNAKELKVKIGEIKFDKITFGYDKQDNLFDNLSLTIKSNERVGLVGYSGSGKTSFMNLILRLFDLRSGNITIDRQNISQVKQSSIREQISVVSQDLILFHDTIIENIRYGRLNASNHEVKYAAALAGINDFITNLPNGYNTKIGEKGFKLSGGERQRISIARAFLKNAPILLLDEATNQLDSLNERKIQFSLLKLMQNKTALIVAHRLSTIMHLDRILVFEAGRIVQDGDHNDLINKDGLYKNLWQIQNNFIHK